MTEAASKLRPNSDHSEGWDLLRFPYRRIVASWTLEEVFARFVWVAIPLEYFILTRFPGGLSARHGVAAALVALLALLAVLGASVMLAVLPRPRGHSYAERVRMWSVSLVLNWATALALLAVGYAPAVFVGWQPPPFAERNYDLVARFLYRPLDRRLLDINDYPHALDPATFIVYLCYALVAAVLIQGIARRFGQVPKKHMPAGPNVFVVAGLTSIIMMIMHGVTKFP